MVQLIVYGAIITAVLGVVAKIITDKRGDTRYMITKWELVVASLAMLFVFIPLTAYLGYNAAIQNQVSYNENWSGWELEAVLTKHKNYEDGSQRHDWVETRMEWVDETYTDTVPDGKGGTKTVTKTRRVLKPVDHYIPYTTEEWTMTVRHTLGDTQIAYRFLPENPNNYRFRRGVRVPEQRFKSTTGYHPFWLEVRERIRNDDPGPVTLRFSYDNFILASQSSILKKYNDSIERYTTQKLLPDLNSKIRDPYFSDRVYFVGTRPPGDWQSAINRFNAALGSTLQGDLHLVIVDANKVTDQHNYAGALTAFWQSEKFGKDALSKNGIVIILGTKDGKTIAWSKASTGMPMGNEHLLQQIEQELKGVSLDPQTLLGNPEGSIAVKTDKATGKPKQYVKVTNSSSELEKLIWGPYKFDRVHMTDKDGDVGYSYLLMELQPTTVQIVFILLVITLLACIAWGICIAVGPQTYQAIRESFNRRRRRY